MTATPPAAAPLLALSGTDGGSALWYLSRGTGMISLVLLTLVVVLGIQVRRSVGPGSSTLVPVTVHRNASLLVLALLAVHIATAVLDPFASIRLLDAFVPFGASYRPLWLGLGALTLDLLIALVVTSLLRVRLGLRSWRAVHWLAYLAWPVAVLHGLGTGTDASAIWALLITVGCVLAVVASVLARARLISDRFPGRRLAAIAAALLAPLVLAGWALLGPLAPGWAARAGTPASLLSGGKKSGATPAAARPSGTAAWTGRLRRTDGTDEAHDALRTLVLTGALTNGPGGQLEIRLSGPPTDGGGVVLSRGSVTWTPTGAGRWSGTVNGLTGDRVTARLTSSDGVSSVPVQVRLRLREDSDLASGTAVFG